MVLEGGSVSKNGGWNLVHAFESEVDGVVQNNLIGFATISDEEKQVLHEANRLVETASERLHIIDAVHSNVEDLIEIIVSVGAQHLQPTVFYPNLREFPKEVSRRLLNLCASFNAMIKHHDALLVRNFGRSSSQVSDWREFKNKLQRTRFGFALMYGLRNYIEHVDMPSISYNIHQTKNETVKVSIELSRDAFLVDEVRLGPEITTQFKAQPEEIALLPLLENWHEVFYEIAHYVLGLRIGDIQQSAQAVAKIRNQYNVSEEGEVGFWFVPDFPEKPTNLKIEITWLSDIYAMRLCKLMNWTSPS